MSDTAPQSEHVRLNVLPNSGKVEQMRAEMQAKKKDGFVPNPNPSTPAYRGHVNKTPGAPNEPKTVEQKIMEGRIVAALRTVYDPEIPIDIYELGLIYDIIMKPDGSVHVRMTLTAPNCPVAGILPLNVQQKVMEVEGVHDCTVEIVWEPQWTKDMMSEAAMLELGLC